MRYTRFHRGGAHADMLHGVDRLSALVGEVLPGRGSAAGGPASGIVIYRDFGRTSRTRAALLRHRLTTAGLSCTTTTPTTDPALPTAGATGGPPAPAVLVDATGGSDDAVRWSGLHDVPLVRLAGSDTCPAQRTRHLPESITTLVWLVEHPPDDAKRAPRGAALHHLSIRPHAGAATRLSVQLENPGTEIAVPCPPHTGLHLYTHADGLAVSTPPDPTSIGVTRTDAGALVTTAGGLAQVHADTRVVLALPAGPRLRVHARAVEVWYA